MTWYDNIKDRLDFLPREKEGWLEGGATRCKGAQKCGYRPPVVWIGMFYGYGPPIGQNRNVLWVRTPNWSEKECSVGTDPQLVRIGKSYMGLPYNRKARTASRIHTQEEKGWSIRSLEKSATSAWYRYVPWQEMHGAWLLMTAGRCLIPRNRSMAYSRVSTSSRAPPAWGAWLEQQKWRTQKGGTTEGMTRYAATAAAKAGSMAG